MFVNIQAENNPGRSCISLLVEAGAEIINRMALRFDLEELSGLRLT